MKRYLIKEILLADTYERIALAKRLSDDKEVLIDFESKVSYDKGDMIYVEGELKIDDFKVIKNSEKE
jgi:hypothetical protein